MTYEEAENKVNVYEDSDKSGRAFSAVCPYCPDLHKETVIVSRLNDGQAKHAVVGRMIAHFRRKHFVVDEPPVAEEEAAEKKEEE
ncbi:hypothetical protein KBB96_07000 [Luteolibacter ambystomatis]|uniref:Uncharacterized protein n=1 Tax=Luteolibacter ambystomatis TaxID=2824561 RepID=A0A975J242_9BACT|nr:hypothetical protein [Luteolibacter ambystomatis]QUE52635.1 hypothetical protein KBB96_07000 [Luteolibacter ambystomatis]